MRKFNYVCSFLLIITVTLFIVTFGQNIVARTSGTYLYYFNDTRAVDSLYIDYSSSEVADDIAHFMNSWRPKEFQIYEDTGYDMQGVFSAEESSNMLKVKTAVDISFIICIVSLIISAAIYVYFLKNDFKLVLRKRLIAVLVLSAILLTCEVFLMCTSGGTAWMASFLGLQKLSKTSSLVTILGIDFIKLASKFLLGYTAIAAGAISYFTYILSKPPRIFY